MPNQVIASPLDFIDTTSGSVATPSAGNTTFFSEGGIAKTKDSSGTVRILGTTTVQGRTSISLTSGNNILTAASTYYQNITGFSFWPMTLPNVTTLAIGHSFEITNNHSAQCPISSNNATWIVQVPVGYTYKFVCISTSDNTPAGWLFFHIPSGVNTGNQALTNTSNATSHTITLSGTGGSVQLVEGSGITLTTSGTASDAIVTVSSTGGGGGSITVTQILLDFGVQAVSEYVFTVTEALCSPTSKITFYLSGIGDSRQNDELEFAQINCTAIPGTGTFDVYCVGTDDIFGNYSFNYFLT